MEENSQLIVNAAIKKGQLVLQLADEKAEAIIAEAKLKAASEAEKLLAKARQEAEKEALKIIAEAKNRAEMMTLIIRQEAQQLEHATAKVLANESPAPRAPVSVRTEPVTQVIKEQTLNGRGEYAINTAAILYHGIMELVVLPPASSKQLFGFLLSLKKIPGVKVLHFKGRVSGGFIVKIKLQAATPLLNIISTLPEVKKASSGIVSAAYKDAPQQKEKEGHQNTIVVTLKS